jgi:hypothetical protein
MISGAFGLTTLNVGVIGWREPAIAYRLLIVLRRVGFALRLRGSMAFR